MRILGINDKRDYLISDKETWQVSDGTFSPLDMFDLAQVNYWKNSLIEIKND